MRARRTGLLSLAAAVFTHLAAGAPARAAGHEEALALVPADAASVGVVRLDALRASPLAGRLFAETDDLAVDGDAARFLAETGLRPKQDVDLVVVAGLVSPTRRDAQGLVLFEGRFDPARLEAAMIARGGVRKETPNGSYVSIGNRHGEGSPAALAFVSRGLLVAGNPSAVTRALADHAAGGSGFLRGEGLGRQMHRVPADASAWAIVDATRTPFARGRSSEPRDGDAADALVGAMKSVTLFVFHATSRGDSVELSATGLSADGETRELLEDALKGVVAMWRLAVHEKSPELVPILRKFNVERDDEGVSITGTLPANFVRKMVERPHAEARQGSGLH
jgi:hypothetical protein